MSSFWTTILDWFLPTIRLSDDSYDIEALRISNRIASSHHRALGSVPASGPDATGHHRDHKSGRVSRRESETDVNGHRSKSDHEDHEMRRLREENERLRQQVSHLKTQLDSQGERTRLPLSTSSRVSSPPFSSPPVSPTSAISPTTSSSEYYKSKYDKLRKEHELTHQTLSNYTAELVSLRSFLSKTDAFDNAFIMQNVQDLNGQIQQFAANVADTFHADLRAAPEYRRKVAEMHSHFATVEQVVGGRMAELVMDSDHMADPMLLQYALQAWEVGCVSLVLDAFCFGTPELVDKTLSVVFQKMHVQEPIATAARWRALTHSYLKGQMSPSSGVLSPPVTPNSSHPPLDFREQRIQKHVDENLAGVHAILAIAGYHRSSSTLREKIRERYTPKLRLLCEEALKIANSLREAFMSQSMEIVIVPPWRAELQTTSRAGGAGLRIVVNGGHSDVPRFDGATMENVLALPTAREGEKPVGHQASDNNVLCTVELGLATTREKEQNKETTMSSFEKDGRSSSVPRSSIDAPQTISRTSSSGGPKQRELVRELMLKPKVLLESFVRYLDN